MAKDDRTYTEAILLAQLTIRVDQYIRDTGIARPKPRSIDKMLADVGLKTTDIANLLGKTERAVQLQLATDNKKTKKVAAGKPIVSEEGSREQAHAR